MKDSKKKQQKYTVSENLRIIRRILHYLRRYIFFLIAAFIFAGISSVLALYLPVLTGNAVDLIVTKGNVDFDGLKLILMEMAAIIAVCTVSQWITNACNNHVAYSTVRDIRNDSIKKANALSIAYHDAHRTGETVNRVISDADQFSDGLLLGFTQFFTGLITIIGTLVMMLTIDVRITILVVVMTPLSILVASFIASSSFKFFKEQSEKRGEQTSIITEMIEQEKLMIAFSAEGEAAEDFDANNDVLAKASLKATFVSSLTNPSTRFINNMIYACVAIFGAILVVGGEMSVGALTAVLGYANQYTKPFNEISGVVTELQNALACAGRLFELIDEKTDEDSEALVTEFSTKGEVELKDVSFSYDKNKELLKNVNVHVHPGERYAIVGPTGCGKTTLINLLMRFYDVDSGSILVDGTDIMSVEKSALRKEYGMVLQDTWLKPGTIRENIIMGKPEASEEEMIRACRNAHAHSFIKQLENGYDTVIGEDGGALSQGQKQLICISRIMLTLPPMLILDEATSSIDTRTELKIQDAFAEMMQGRTSFIVAHRLSTIKNADCILVMRDGNIIEQGKHEELLAAGGFYKTLYKSQFEH